jgi:hypothetical protein
MYSYIKIIKKVVFKNVQLGFYEHSNKPQYLMKVKNIFIDWKRTVSFKRCPKPYA